MLCACVLPCVFASRVLCPCVSCVVRASGRFFCCLSSASGLNGTPQSSASPQFPGVRLSGWPVGKPQRFKTASKPKPLQNRYAREDRDMVRVHVVIGLIGGDTGPGYTHTHAISSDAARGQSGAFYMRG